MEMFKFGFLFIGNEYFHDRYHEPHLGENQAVSMITGIYPSSFKLLLCWLRSLAAALQLEIYWVYSFIYYA
uniref:hypothetical protein n=1 Tax=Photorhabdus thracensis TaxID=230089 RepID=UPI001E48B47C